MISEAMGAIKPGPQERDISVNTIAQGMPSSSQEGTRMMHYSGLFQRRKKTQLHPRLSCAAFKRGIQSTPETSPISTGVSKMLDRPRSPGDDGMSWLFENSISNVN
jgi:hypothetical protein